MSDPRGTRSTVARSATATASRSATCSGATRSPPGTARRFGASGRGCERVRETSGRRRSSGSHGRASPSDGSERLSPSGELLEPDADPGPCSSDCTNGATSTRVGLGRPSSAPICRRARSRSSGVGDRRRRWRTPILRPYGLAAYVTAEPRAHACGHSRLQAACRRARRAPSRRCAFVATGRLGRAPGQHAAGGAPFHPRPS